MQEFIKELKARRIAIANRTKELGQYVRELQQLDSELRHINALLSIYTQGTDKSENNAGQIPNIHILYSHNNKKIPSGIARHILTVFAEDNKPMPINAIHQCLKDRGINATMSGVNTALRRNTAYFEQGENFFWKLKTDNTQQEERRGEKEIQEAEGELIRS